MKTHSKHRHFLAAPLAGVLITVTVVQGNLAGNLVQSDLHAASQEESTLLPYGARAAVSGGEGIVVSGEQAALISGTALVASQGLSRIQVGPLTVSQLHGLSSITYQSGQLSVAALTTPVVITQGVRMHVVPPGMQWRTATNQQLPLIRSGPEVWFAARSVEPIPHAYRTRSLKQGADLVSALHSDVPLALDTPPLPSWSTLAPVRLGRSREESIRAWEDAVFAYARFLLQSQKQSAFQESLEHEEFGPVLQSPRSIAYMSQILVNLDSSSQEAMHLLSHLTQSDDLWLLALFHNDLRDRTWTLLHPRATRDAIALSVSMLPVSDVQREPLSPFVFNRWLQSARGSLKVVPDAEDFLTNLIDLMFAQRAILEEQGYPERARRHSEMILSLSEAASDFLSDSVVEKLGALDESERVVVEWVEDLGPGPGPEEKIVSDPNPDSNSSSFSNSQDDSRFALSPDEIVYRADRILQAIGAIYAVSTHVEASGSTHASVSNIIFAAPSGDMVLSFVLDVSSGNVSNVIYNAKELPYPLSLEQFVGWIHSS